MQSSPTLTTLCIPLTRSGETERGVTFRSRIFLKAAEGLSSSKIAEALGTSRPTVIDWRKRYAAEGMIVRGDAALSRLPAAKKQKSSRRPCTARPQMPRTGVAAS